MPRSQNNEGLHTFSAAFILRLYTQVKFGDKVSE
jgi:hypothetical protein